MPKHFTKEFEAEAVRLARTSGRTHREIAKTKDSSLTLGGVADLLLLGKSGTCRLVSPARGFTPAGSECVRGRFSEMPRPQGQK